MKQMDKAILLRIFIDETDQYKNRPLYKQIVLKARKMKLAGATVIRGILGFGIHSHLHSAKLLTLSENLPIIIEIVDNEENINKLLPFIDEVIKDGLITKETVDIIKYRER